MATDHCADVGIVMGPEFNKSLRKVTKPKLESLGFKFNGKRQFTKIDENGAERIIKYQVGVRAIQGRFAVNLFSEMRCARLATLRPTIVSRLANSLFGDYDPRWKGVFLPKDDWWRIDLFQAEMDSIVKQTVDNLKSFGISWFDREDII